MAAGGEAEPVEVAEMETVEDGVGRSRLETILELGRMLLGLTCWVWCWAWD